MLISTHIIISKSVLDNLESNNSFFLSEKNFIYGNIKPDIPSKYLFKTHYLEESLSMILEKIKYLSNLTLDSLKKYFSISKLSQELGVICHFLCDFFTTPHSERWRFTHSMNKHVTYEKELAAYAKNMDFSSCDLTHEIEHTVEDFFHKLYKKYKNCEISYENDLKYSYHVCSIVVNHILSSILTNTANSYTLEKFRFA